MKKLLSVLGAIAILTSITAFTIVENKTSSKSQKVDIKIEVVNNTLASGRTEVDMR